MVYMHWGYIDGIHVTIYSIHGLHYITQMLHVWYIYLHLGDLWGKCW